MAVWIIFFLYSPFPLSLLHELLFSWSGEIILFTFFRERRSILVIYIFLPSCFVKFIVQPFGLRRICLQSLRIRTVQSPC